jgi:CRISPR type I-E-associated protein CasB/Cse2
MNCQDYEKKHQKFLSDLAQSWKECPYLLKRIHADPINMYKIFRGFCYDFLGGTNGTSDQVYAYYNIASAFPYNPHFSHNKNSFGSLCKMIWKDSDSIEHRFRLIINSASRKEMFENHCLVNMVKLLESKDVTVDYVTLLTDLWFWGDRTKEKWIADFYSMSSHFLTNE